MITDYQHGYDMYHVKTRRHKAKKIIAVLDNYYRGDLANLSLLDIGCSVGIITSELSKRVAKAVGVDVEKEAIEYAQKNYGSDNLEFKVGNCLKLDFPDMSFDVVICVQTYEHVLNVKQLLSEIHRVLKPNCVCYFSAANRLSFIEPHHKLPLLSIIPKPLAHLYLRALGRTRLYEEKLLTLYGLKKVTSNFHIIDYTLGIVSDPEKYCATDMIKPNSIKQKIAIQVAKKAYWLFPTYVWLLRK